MRRGRRQSRGGSARPGRQARRRGQAARGAGSSDKQPFPRHVRYGDGSNVGTGDAGDHVTILNADGSFVSCFRICKEDAAEQQSIAVETGDWNEDGNVERTVTRTVDGHHVDASEYHVEHYELRRLSPGTVQKTLRRNGEV